MIQMQEIVKKVLNGEAVKGMLGLGLDENGLHILFQEEDTTEVLEEVIPAYMLAMLSQLVGE